LAAQGMMKEFWLAIENRYPNIDKCSYLKFTNLFSCEVLYILYQL